MIRYTNPTSQNGSALFIVLIAVVLLAALTYAISNGDSGAKGLSSEKTRLVASEIIDQGEKFSEGVPRIRLQGIPVAQVSFANSAVTGYTNAACTTNNCLFFADDGGGFSWISAPPNVNNGEKWGFTGDLAVKNIGTTTADIVAILPNISLDVCMVINQLLSINPANTAPSVIATVSANKFVGTFNATPVSITASDLDGKKSGCFKATSMAGTAIDGGPFNGKYAYYHVLYAQ